MSSNICTLISGVLNYNLTDLGKLSYDYTSDSLVLGGTTGGYIPLGVSGMMVASNNVHASGIGVGIGQFYRTSTGVLKVRY